MNDADRLLLTYARRHLSEKQLQTLAQAGIPLTGPDGLRRWIAERNMEAFTRLYFPEEFCLEPPPIHRKLFADMQEVAQRAQAGKRGLKLARVIPRGHAKTTLLSRILPLHGLLYGWSPLTVLLGNNQSAAERLLKNIRDALESNVAILEDFGDVRGDTWGASQLASNAGCSIYAFGRGSGAIRGVSNPVRPRLVCADDLDDDSLVRSATELEAAEEWWDKAVLAVGDNVAFTTSFIVAGTLIRASSLLGHIIQLPDFDTLIERAIKRFATNADLWEQWKEHFLERARNGDQPKEATADSFYREHRAEMLEGTQVLWPRQDQYWELMVKRLALGDAAFNSEFQNDPGSIGGRLGKLRMISKLPEDLRGFRRYAALDSTVKGGKSNDLAAWVEALFHPQRRQLYIVYLDAKQRPYNETIDAVMGRLRSTRYDGIWIETNGSGWMLADLLDQRISNEGLYYTPQRIHNSVPKADRISAIPEYVSLGQFFVLDDVDPEFAREYEHFPHYRFDDAIDAAATIVTQLKRLGLLDLVTA